MTAAVRVRGIYATALTRLLSADHKVVQSTRPIRERFGEPFSDVPATVTVETSDDRQGVGVSGDADAVESVAAVLRGVAVDALAWTAVPQGAVFDGRVTETLSGGAVVDLGESEGYLPYGNVDGYVETGDDVRVQVREAVPLWSDDRPVLDTGLSVSNGLARLVRGGTGGGAAIDFADILSTEPLDGWGVSWHERADDAALDALQDALCDCNERAARVEDALASQSNESRRLTTGRETVWVWFGRESRFALDEQRRAVTRTMPGHHRIKAATDAASAAVDFAEAVCEPQGSFPFDVTAQKFGPRVDDRVAIGHGKPDGRLIVLGRGEVTDYDPDGTITLERQMSPGGRYDALGVERRAGDVALTKLTEGRWWYPTVYRGTDGERRGTYVNVCTPVELFPTVARYVDLHVDVVKHANGTVQRVDDDELATAVECGHVTSELAEKARTVATAVERALRE